MKNNPAGYRFSIKTFDFRFKLAGFYLILVLFLAVFAPLLPLPFLPNELHPASAYSAPLSVNPASGKMHWLGTDQLGRDVLANVIYGFRAAFAIALPVTLVSMFIGVALGSAAGYWGNRKIMISIYASITFLLWLFLVYFYVIYLPFFSETGIAPISQIGLLGLITLLCFGFSKLLKTVPVLTKNRFLPLDELVLKATEVLASVPRVILILCLAGLAEPGAGNVILLLSLTYWAGPARLVRAEVLKIRELPFIDAAVASGLTDRRIIRNHILPNLLPSVITAACFDIGSLMGLEATLSFLGIGLSPETPGWGRTISAIRLDFNAWWLVVFPGIALTLTILAIQNIGNTVKEALMKK